MQRHQFHQTRRDFFRDAAFGVGAIAVADAMLRRLAQLLDRRLGELDARIGELTALREEIVRYRTRVEGRVEASPAPQRRTA